MSLFNLYTIHHLLQAPLDPADCCYSLATLQVHAGQAAIVAQSILNVIC